VSLVTSKVIFKNRYFAVFFMQIDGTAKLEFIENLDYKYIELFSVEFLVSSEETIR
jgi:hypothetical protein